jgi:hypothetical protein
MGARGLGLTQRRRATDRALRAQAALQRASDEADVNLRYVALAYRLYRRHVRRRSDHRPSRRRTGRAHESRPRQLPRLQAVSIVIRRHQDPELAKPIASRRRWWIDCKINSGPLHLEVQHAALADRRVRVHDGDKGQRSDPRRARRVAPTPARTDRPRDPCGPGCASRARGRAEHRPRRTVDVTGTKRPGTERQRR